MSAYDTHPGNSILHLLSELKEDFTDLVRQEIALAKKELIAKTAGLGRAGAFFALAGVVGVFCAFFLLIFLNNLLQAGLTRLGLNADASAWCAPLILGVALAIGGIVLALTALKSLRRASPVPSSDWRAVKSLREDKRQIKAALKDQK